MIKIFLPKKYELIPNGLFVSDIDSKYKTDVVYNETSDPVKYEKFLQNLFSIAKPTQRRFLDTVKQFIINYTVCVSTSLDSPSYFYTRNRIIINLPDNKLDRISLILGSTFFYIVATTPQKSREIYISHTALITAYLISKVSSRSIDFKEISPRLIQYLIGWFLRKYDRLSPQNLSRYSVAAKRGFVSANELRDVYETIKELKHVDEFFDLIEDLLSINTFKQAFIARYGIDVLLLFDDIAHLLYNVTSALYLNYPSILNQYLTKSVVRKNAESIARSISSRLWKLPSF